MDLLASLQDRIECLFLLRSRKYLQHNNNLIYVFLLNQLFQMKTITVLLCSSLLPNRHIKLIHSTSLPVLNPQGHKEPKIVSTWQAQLYNLQKSSHQELQNPRVLLLIIVLVNQLLYQLDSILNL